MRITLEDAITELDDWLRTDKEGGYQLRILPVTRGVMSYISVTLVYEYKSETAVFCRLSDALFWAATLTRRPLFHATIPSDQVSE